MGLFSVLCNHNDLLRVRFQLWKSFGSGSVSGFGSGSAARQYLAVFQQQKTYTKSFLFNFTKQHYFLERWPDIFDF